MTQPTLFGFNVLEECDVISMDTILRENEWKAVWKCRNDYWQMLDPEARGPEASKLAWLQTLTECPPVVSKVQWGGLASNNDVHASWELKIWIRPEDYVLFVLKFA